MFITFKLILIWLIIFLSIGRSQISIFKGIFNRAFARVHFYCRRIQFESDTSIVLINNMLDVSVMHQ